jgi:hypothetical protein
MATIEGFDFFPLHFDGDGALKAQTELDALAAHIATASATDLVTIAHGFRNSEAEANGLYTEFLKNFRAHLARPELASLTPRRFAVAGVFWPSKAFAEGPQDKDAGGVQSAGDGASERREVEAQLRNLLDESASEADKKAVAKALALLDDVESKTSAQDALVATLLSLVGDAPAGDDEGLSVIQAQRGSEVLAKLEAPILLPTAKSNDEGGVMAIGGGNDDGDSGGVLGIGGFFSSIFGRVGQVLNVTTWYMMKSRSGTVGFKGLAPAIRALKAKTPALKVHIVGHSLGGRLSAACAKALSDAPMLQPESLALLEAAFSHYGFSANNGEGKPGFFREVIARKIVKGPLISTFSVQDTVVGKAYAIASRLADDNTQAVGDENDQYGGIGRNGSQKTAESARQVLHAPGAAYTFSPGVVHDLDGSGGLIKDHGDVRNPHVTYAVASAIAHT